ncbi:hypothetical protein L7F22_061218 [Adiantum nelumboides]|nr:hypothetical protein [Adiantum nelumboides]
MGDAMKADGAFIGQNLSVTPLIGKLRLHIQGYVYKEDFFISPLKHEDVILGAPWFDRLAASIKFPERKIFFKLKEKDIYINAQESCISIPLVNDQAFDKSIKGSISAYMIFVKDSLSDVNKTQVNESGMHEDLELSKFLNQFQDVFIDDILGELPPKRGEDDHAIELLPVLCITLKNNLSSRVQRSSIPGPSQCTLAAAVSAALHKEFVQNSLVTDPAHILSITLSKLFILGFGNTIRASHEQLITFIESLQMTYEQIECWVCRPISLLFSQLFSLIINHIDIDGIPFLNFFHKGSKDLNKVKGHVPMIHIIVKRSKQLLLQG